MAEARPCDYDSSSDTISDESESEDEINENSDDKDSNPEGNGESRKESDTKSTRISPKEIKQYFQVNLKYNQKPNMFLSTTILQYTLKPNPLTTHSKDSNSNERRRNSLYNSIQHAEEKLLKILETECESYANDELLPMFENLQLTSQVDHADTGKDEYRMKMDLKIIQNFSPCNVCAHKFIVFMEKFADHYDIRISITFASFYLFYPKDDRTKNIEGLAKLQNAGIKLRLVWDSKSLKKIIKKIGTEKEREEREIKDREYMELVKRKAEELAASKG